MEDPILEERLESLKQDLEQMKQPSTWQDELHLKNVRPEREVWRPHNRAMRQKVEARLKTLGAIQAHLAQAGDAEDAEAAEIIQQAWHDYTRLYQDCQEIFRETLELIGGLALRDKYDDERLFIFADELIHVCAKTTLNQPSLTVPAQEEALSMTVGRIVRLRFPDWSIWTLPFVAHEFGHVVIEEKEGLRDLVADEVATLMQQEPIYRLLSDEDIEKAEERANGYKLCSTEEFAAILYDAFNVFPQTEDFQQGLAQLGREHLITLMASKITSYAHQIEELVADAFATYNMGPAYACSALLIRFNPALAYQDTLEHPGDAKRARVIIEMLKMLNQEEKGRSRASVGPYDAVIEELENIWGELLARARPEGELSGEAEAYLAELTGRIWQCFDDEYFIEGRYPKNYRDQEGWETARRWAELWSERLEERRRLEAPDVQTTSKLRDALNAAWCCRLDYPDRVREITDVTLELCEAIIEKRMTGGAQVVKRGSGPSRM